MGLWETSVHFCQTELSGDRPLKQTGVASRLGGNQRQCPSEAKGEPWRLSTNARTPKPPAGIFIIPVAGSENLFHLAWESLGEWEVWLVGNLWSMHPSCSECFDTSKASRCGQGEILALGQTGYLSRQITPRRAARFKRSEGRAEASGPLAAWPHIEATRSALIMTGRETQRRTASKSRA